jgi:hypothetical protein
MGCFRNRVIRPPFDGFLPHSWGWFSQSVFDEFRVIHGVRFSQNGIHSWGYFANTLFDANFGSFMGCFPRGVIGPDGRTDGDRLLPLSTFLTGTLRTLDGGRRRPTCGGG